MNRNVKSLQVKSRTHTVRPLSRSGAYKVTSGNPESTDGPYVVELRDGEAPTCGCTFKQYHPDGLCSHGLAVLNAVAEAEGRYVSLWSNEADAIRQKAPRCKVPDVGGAELWITRRKGQLTCENVKYPTT